MKYLIIAALVAAATVTLFSHKGSQTIKEVKKENEDFTTAFSEETHQVYKSLWKDFDAVSTRIPRSVFLSTTRQKNWPQRRWFDLEIDACNDWTLAIELFPRYGGWHVHAQKNNGGSSTPLIVGSYKECSEYLLEHYNILLAEPEPTLQS